MSGANAFTKQPPLRQQHWLMSFVAISPSPSIRQMSIGLSDIRVVKARLRRAWPVNMRTALEKPSRLYD
jgi:hypothetical protein